MAGYGEPLADQSLQQVPMQVGMLSMHSCDHDSEMAKGDESLASNGGFYGSCMRILGCRAMHPVSAIAGTAPLLDCANDS